jgi:hypothetical protein
MGVLAMAEPDPAEPELSATPLDETPTLCDRCGDEFPACETRSCRCGWQICDDCAGMHSGECQDEEYDNAD